MNNTTIIIMAGGLGKRMGTSAVPKVLHLVGGVPMIVRILREISKIEVSASHNIVRILIVVGKYRDIIEETIKKYTDITVEYVLQDPPLGTGHAIACCLPYIDRCTSGLIHTIVVLSGDVPLIRGETIKKMIVGNPALRVLTMMLDVPTGYGRIIETSSNIEKIVEERDCTDLERLCSKVNCGIYAFSGVIAHQFIPLIQNNNAQAEYYLTDIVGLARNSNIVVETTAVDNNQEVLGINTLMELNRVNDLIIDMI
jgi:bifunctional N-acetylglucosamine-1-phosphate-uridyltransferase/glucosamine-1-phosphate-acetyltransferase GlmU-like protein